MTLFFTPVETCSVEKKIITLQDHVTVLNSAKAGKGRLASSCSYMRPILHFLKKSDMSLVKKKKAYCKEVLSKIVQGFISV